jgi:multiple sugar transport system ATP-binding protein
MAEIALGEIRKRFGETVVLNGVSLDIGEGEFVALLGPSGCGKSTLLRIIAGLEQADSGTVRIGGRDMADRPPAARNLAMVFQSYALYPHLSVHANMMVPLRMRDLTGFERLPLIGALAPGRRAKLAAMAARVGMAAETLKISHLLDRKPGQLSGGQRQRVALGRAMVREPAAFLMDEPLSNLDAALRVHMRTEIAELHRALGATFVYVTHDQVEAMTMSSRIAVMLDGEIVQIGAPAEIYEDPHDLRVAEFIGSPRINVIEALADAAGAPVAGHGAPLGGGFAATPGAALRVGIRPEHLALAEPARAPLAGRVRHRENLGAEMLLHVAVPGIATPVVARVAPQAARALGPEAQVGLVFDPADLRVFDANGRRVAALARPERSRAYG